MHQYIIEKLSQGDTVVHKEGGNSMVPIIKSRQPVTLAPCQEKDLAKGDIVFCKVRGRHFVHLIKAIKNVGGTKKFLIGNNHGHNNGWIGFTNIFGKVVKIG